ncbi:C6 zinc finger domain protein [Colletotrichum karsti]|uniref:C6 zinc finger domain protein n=1 Tax=Colletotrichum karsti TaxID=1095194 RepID=A0A9P6LQ28_9PEZI|nr:C6 zinc finger domain protein [Colletotrichum karsti]KAF9880262.1 C6 zinc finger domain protein [Colletotrichum karsti]
MTEMSKQPLITDSTPMETSQAAAGGGRGRKKSCWECQRRGKVCDSARPVCSNCKLNSIVCPGYENIRPLTWVAPNMVTTKPWRSKRSPANKSDAAKKRGKEADKKGGDKQEAVQQASSENRIVHIFPQQELRTETCDIGEASHYLLTEVYFAGNEFVWPYFHSNQLSKSPWVVPISNINNMKPYRRHGLVAMAIEHRMSRLSPTRDDPYAAEVRARGYHHRFTAIQALNKEIENENTRSADATLAGVIVFLFGDVRQRLLASE